VCAAMTDAMDVGTARRVSGPPNDPPATRADGLLARLRDEIRADGPLTFARFMERALYEPRHGYYRATRRAAGHEPVGRAGDFVTNDRVQPVFGRLLAEGIRRWRRELDKPDDFGVVDVGAGRGETVGELDRCLPGVPCAGVEGDGGAWPARPFPGVVLSNELFDTQPVRLVERRAGALHELLVDEDGAGGLRLVPRPLRDERMRDWLARYAPGLADGQRVEVGLAALALLEKLADHLRRGVLLTIDYGYEADELAGARRFGRGSLQAYRRHRASDDVLRDPGAQDVTAHVHWTALREHGRRLGLRPEPLRSQGSWLTGIGEDDAFAAALDARDEQHAAHLRGQLKQLLLLDGTRFQVLVQRKG